MLLFPATRENGAGCGTYAKTTTNYTFTWLFVGGSRGAEVGVGNDSDVSSVGASSTLLARRKLCLNPGEKLLMSKFTVQTPS